MMKGNGLATLLLVVCHSSVVWCQNDIKPLDEYTMPFASRAPQRPMKFPRPPESSDSPSDLQSVALGEPETHHEHKPMPYSFSYNVNHEPSGNVHSRKEVGDETGLVTGTYQLIEPDGSLRIVEYTADWINGFRATVRVIPNYAPPHPPSPTRAQTIGTILGIPTTTTPISSSVETDSPTTKDPLSVPFKVGPHTVVCLTC